MATVSLATAPREGSGKGVARKLRAAERVPAIVYGYDTEPYACSVDSAELRKALSTDSGSRVVLRLDVEGRKEPIVSIVREIQRHPVSRAIIHLDLLAIDLRQPVEVSVPIQAIGTPVGVRMEGGALSWARREIYIRVLPTAIPEVIELDISELHINQALHMEDLQPEGYEVIDDPHLTICSVASTKLEIESDTEEDEEGEVAEDGDEAEESDSEEPEPSEG